jgi:probable F420-dependent oxidoreductase
VSTVELGEVGIWTTYGRIGEGNAAAAAALTEDLGFGTFWLGGSPELLSVRPLLAATNRIAVATGIVNVWRTDPNTLAAEHAELKGAFPGRLLLGIGVGHPEVASEYTRPFTAMVAFLDGLDRADPPVPREERCIAALGPKMLKLAAERCLGALPYFVPVEHTRFARDHFGPTPLLATELACVIDSDADRARAAARSYAGAYLRLSNYTRNLRRFGFADEDFIDGGSDRLIDAVIPHGSPGEVAAIAREHLAAGADHVCLQPVGVTGIPRAEWTALASELIR